MCSRFRKANDMEWFYLITVLASSLAAVLAWLAKLRWSKEFAAAKDATIEAKDAQIDGLKREIESLRELTPMKLREYYLSIKQQLEEYIEALHQQLAGAKAEIEAKNAAIATLRTQGTMQSQHLQGLERDRDALQQKTSALEHQLKQIEADALGIPRIPELDLEAVRRTFAVSNELRTALARVTELPLVPKIDTEQLERMLSKIRELTTFSFPASSPPPKPPSPRGQDDDT